jgi:hypothetical protein
VIATRTRPYTDPHPTIRIQEDALQRQRERFAERKRAISRLVAEAPSDQKEIFHWTLVYDLEQAPLITSRELLLTQGIIPCPPQELITDLDVHDELWTVIEGMAKTGIYLLNTDHMCDRDVYARLYFRILDEQTRGLPPAAEACEYIDCLHELDMDHPLGKKLAARKPAQPTPTYVRGPACPLSGELADRDRYLPRPSNPND